MTINCNCNCTLVKKLESHRTERAEANVASDSTSWNSVLEKNLETRWDENHSSYFFPLKCKKIVSIFFALKKLGCESTNFWLQGWSVWPIILSGIHTVAFLSRHDAFTDITIVLVNVNSFCLIRWFKKAYWARLDDYHFSYFYIHLIMAIYDQS